MLDVVINNIGAIMAAGFWLDLLVASSIFIGFLMIRGILVKIVFQTLQKLSGGIKLEVDGGIWRSFEGPLKTFLAVLGLYLALAYLPLSPLLDHMVVKFFRTAAIVLLTWGLYNLTGDYLFREISKKIDAKIDKILIPFATKILRFVIIALAVTVVVQEWGYNVTGFIAGLGLGGLAFALAAKDTVSNIFGGFVIITDKPFSIGDWINTPSVEGTVEDISFRSTKVRTFADSLVTVPNSTLANEPVTNWSRMGKRRVSFHLGVTYATDREKLEKCVLAIRSLLESHPGVHQERIIVSFDRFGESSLDIYIYFFTASVVWNEFIKVKEEINFKIMEILERVGVSVAFPSRSIYMETPLCPSVESPQEEVQRHKEE